MGNVVKSVTFNDLEVEIVGEIKKWRDGLIENYGGNSPIRSIDAGDAADLASMIVLQVINPGVQIVGELRANRRLSEGWQ